MATLDSPAEIYNHVFDALLMLPEGDWLEIHLHADVDGESVGLTADYRTNTDSTENLDVRKLDHSVSKAIRNLQRIMAGTTGKAWSKAYFLLKRSGEYSVRFD
jgi:hypothetical protein